MWEELEFKNWKNGIQWRWVNGIPMQQGMVQHRTLTNIIMTNWFTNHDSHNPPFLFYFLFIYLFFTLLLSSCSYSSLILFILFIFSILLLSSSLIFFALLPFSAFLGFLHLLDFVPIEVLIPS